jgi:hypothetical protein
VIAFGNSWLLAFALSALAAVLDAWVGDSLLLAAVRGALFGAVFVTAPVLYLALLSPLLPKSVFLPPLLFLVFSVCGGMPLPLWVRFSDLDLGVSSLQLVVAVLAVVRVRVGCGSWWLSRAGDASIGRRQALEFVGICLVAVPLGLLLYVVSSASVAISHFTGGFVRLDSAGLLAEERSYTRGAATVRLIPMVHVGRPGYYEAIAASLPQSGGIILAEGMTDDRGRLQRDLSYAPVASALGLEAQEHALAVGDGHVVENADLDISALSPQTVELVESSAAVLSGETPEERAAAWARVNELVRAPGVVERAVEEVIGMRNRHLLGRIDAALDDYAEIVVPWGAGHMPELERGVLERGFELSGSAVHAVFLFSDPAR